MVLLSTLTANYFIFLSSYANKCIILSVTETVSSETSITSRLFHSKRKSTGQTGQIKKTRSVSQRHQFRSGKIQQETKSFFVHKPDLSNAATITPHYLGFFLCMSVNKPIPFSCTASFL